MAVVRLYLARLHRIIGATDRGWMIDCFYVWNFCEQDDALVCGALIMRLILEY